MVYDDTWEDIKYAFKTLLAARLNRLPEGTGGINRICGMASI